MCLAVKGNNNTKHMKGWQITMKAKKGVSLLVLSITVIVIAIISGATILHISDSDALRKSVKAVNETNLIQAQDVANSAWAVAYGQGKLNVSELESAVYAALQKSNFDLDDYDIVVTLEGVTITIKVSE